MGMPLSGAFFFQRFVLVVQSAPAPSGQVLEVPFCFLMVASGTPSLGRGSMPQLREIVLDVAPERLSPLWWQLALPIRDSW